MFFLAMIEFALCFGLVVLTITQMLIPSLKGTQMFPMFRREHELQNEITELNQQSSEVDLENQAREIRSTIKNKTKRSR